MKQVQTFNTMDPRFEKSKKHKFNIGETVWFHSDKHTIVQRRVDNGHLTYRLDNGSIVHENRLS